MIRSMTAFAGEESTFEDWTVTWEIRTVNHRFLDIALKLPESSRSLESEIRGLINRTLRRGRVEASLILKQVESGMHPLDVNFELVGQIINATQRIESISGTSFASFSSLDLLKWPGVLSQAETDRQALNQKIVDALGRVLTKLVMTREREGQALLDLLISRLDRIEKEVTVAEGRISIVLDLMREKVRQKVSEICSAPDSDRIEQELVHFAQRMDVAEELDRLRVHVNEMRRILRDPEPQGRRLDFLIQEMNREANTLASKSQDTETTRTAVEIKVQLEQMREQVQNIE